MIKRKKKPVKVSRVIFGSVIALFVLAGLFFILIGPLKNLFRNHYTDNAVEAFKNGEKTVTVPKTDVLSVDGENGEEEISGGKFFVDLGSMADGFENLTLVGLLEIPCIEAEQPVFSESSTLALRYGCGIFPGTANIGEKGLCSVWGHRDLNAPKSMLGQLQYCQDHIGESVYITTLDYVKHEYEIVECIYAKDGAVMPWMYKDTYSEEMLCIVTCGFGEDPARPGTYYPYNTEFIVLCKPVGTEVISYE